MATATIDYASLLSARFPEVSPGAFYRDLFPAGSLQECRPGKKGEYPAIAVQIRDGGNLRHTVLDDLSVIEELCATDDFCVMSPVTYAGTSQRKSMAHALYAVVIDLDGLKVRGGEPKGFNALLAMIGREGGLPQPTYIVASGTGLHLYFMLEEPCLLFPEAMDALSEMRRTLTRMVWNPQITTLVNSIQYEGITQGFRMVGTETKVGTRVRAFQTGGRVTMEYLAGFTSGLHLLTPRSRREGVSMEVAKEKWPEWYQKRVVQGVPRGSWRNKRDLYDWWKRRVAEEGTYGHRYNCIVSLAAYAKKCGISCEELEADAEELRQVMNEKPAADEFTKKDVRDALTAFRAGMVTYPIDEIVERTGIKIEKNKRNGRKRPVHIEYMNRIRQFKVEMGECTNGGRPKDSGTKRDEIRAYAAVHPEASQRVIAKTLGVSPTTVNKWLKGV